MIVGYILRHQFNFSYLDLTKSWHLLLDLLGEYHLQLNNTKDCGAFAVNAYAEP